MRIVNHSVPHCTTAIELGGVRMPTTVKFFDCRSPEGAEFAKIGKRTLIGSEKAAYALGLRNDSYQDYDTTSLSCMAYRDFRTCSTDELANAARDMRKAVKDVWREYRSALRNPAGPDNGGSVHYKPVAVVLGNYGWGVLCDRRERAVRAFK